MAYQSRYTGAQIDQAVGRSLATFGPYVCPISSGSTYWSAVPGGSPARFQIELSGNVIRRGKAPFAYFVSSSGQVYYMDFIVTNTNADDADITVYSNALISGAIYII